MVLQERTGRNLIKPDRELIKEGTCKKINRNFLEDRYLVLFSDIFIVAYLNTQSEAGHDLKIAYKLKLDQLVVEGHPDVTNYPNEFNVKSTKKSFSFDAECPDLKNSWIEAISGAIQEVKKRQESFILAGNPVKAESVKFDQIPFNVAPVWTFDERVSMCMDCKHHFTTFLRRHHCRGCGKLVCYNCCDQLAPLRYKQFESDKVCSECFDKIWKGKIHLSFLIGSKVLKNHENQLFFQNGD